MDKLYQFNQPKLVDRQDAQDQEILKGIMRSKINHLSFDELGEIFKTVKQIFDKYNKRNILPETLAQAIPFKFTDISNTGEKARIYAMEYILGKVRTLREIIDEKREKNEKNSEQIKTEYENQPVAPDSIENIEREREKILKEWLGKKKINVYSVADQDRLLKAKENQRNEERTLTKEEKEFRKRNRENEAILGFILNETKSLGQDSNVYPSDEFDDRINGVDLIVRINDNLPLMFIDLTHALGETPDKLRIHVGLEILKNADKKPRKPEDEYRKGPIQYLSYPSSPDLKNGMIGLPIVLGMRSADLEELITLFLSHRPKDGKGKITNKPEHELIEIINPQLKLQRSALEKMPRSWFEHKKISWEKADSEYSKMEKYIDDIKEGPLSSSSSEDSKSSPIHRSLLYPPETILTKYPEDRDLMLSLSAPH